MELPNKSAIIAVLIAICVTAAGCGGTGGGGGGSGVGNLSGSVIDLNFNGVSNVDVVVDSAATKTLSNGLYTFTNIPAGDKVIRLHPTSHTPSYRMASVRGGTSVVAPIAIVTTLESKITPVYTAGGTVTNTNGNIKMIFHNGAFATSPTNVVLTPVPMIAAPLNAPVGKQFVSYVVYAKASPAPTNDLLGATAEIFVPNITGVTTEEVNFYWFDTNLLVWTPITATPTVESNSIKVWTPYVGWIAATMPITPAPGSISGTVVDNGTSNPIAGANVWTMTSYAVTDSMGQFTLTNLPLGSTVIDAAALSYNTYTTTKTIVTGVNPPFEIRLTQAAQGNITGVVSELWDGALSARVVEQHTGGQSETITDPITGRYTLYNVPQGSVQVTAYSVGHASSTESITVPTASDVNFALPLLGPIKTYTFTCESGGLEGFTATGFWHNQYVDPTRSNRPQNYFDEDSVIHQTPPKVILPDDGYIPDAHGGTHYFWFGQVSPQTVEASYIGEQEPTTLASTLDGGISVNANGYYGSLESPSIDLTGYTYGKLSFWTWWEVEGKNPATGFDKMQVLVKVGTGSWQSMGFINPYSDPASAETQIRYPYTSGGYNQPGVWINHNLDLSRFAGNSILIRFEFNTKDNLYNGFRGWFIDDIVIDNSQMGGMSLGAKGLRKEIITKPRN